MAPAPEDAAGIAAPTRFVEPVTASNMLYGPVAQAASSQSQNVAQSTKSYVPPSIMLAVDKMLQVTCHPMLGQGLVLLSVCCIIRWIVMLYSNGPVWLLVLCHTYSSN